MYCGGMAGSGIWRPQSSCPWSEASGFPLGPLESVQCEASRRGVEVVECMVLTALALSSSLQHRRQWLLFALSYFFTKTFEIQRPLWNPHTNHCISQQRKPEKVLPDSIRRPFVTANGIKYILVRLLAPNVQTSPSHFRFFFLSRTTPIQSSSCIR